MESDGEADGVSCGDGVCQKEETWKNCTADCEKPEIVEDAERAIQEAERFLENGTADSELLERARRKFRQENYSGALSLSEKAVESGSEREAGTFERVYYRYLLVLVLLVLLGVVFSGVSAGNGQEE